MNAELGADRVWADSRFPEIWRLWISSDRLHGDHHRALGILMYSLVSVPQLSHRYLISSTSRANNNGETVLISSGGSRR